MKFIIHGKNVEVTEALKAYAQEKLGKIEKYSRHIVDMNVELSVYKNPRIKNNQIVTVTTSVNGSLLRTEEASTSMYAAIDLVAEKLVRQLKKYERKRTDHSAAVKTSVAMSELQKEASEAETPVKKSSSTKKASSKRKIKNERLAIKPMNAEEAAAQLELLNYHFMLFRNQDTNELNIIFKLDGKNKEYGLIIPNESVDEALVMRI